MPVGQNLTKVNLTCSLGNGPGHWKAVRGGFVSLEREGSLLLCQPHPQEHVRAFELFGLVKMCILENVYFGLERDKRVNA